MPAVERCLVCAAAFFPFPPASPSGLVCGWETLRSNALQPRRPCSTRTSSATILVVVEDCAVVGGWMFGLTEDLQLAAFGVGRSRREAA